MYIGTLSKLLILLGDKTLVRVAVFGVFRKTLPQLLGKITMLYSEGS